MSKHHPQSESMKALEQSLNDHMEICSLNRKVKRLKSQNARLKAEVERLTVEADWKTPARKIQALEAENERLRNAGDELAGWFFDYHPSAKAWNAAKEGKGQP